MHPLKSLPAAAVIALAALLWTMPAGRATTVWNGPVVSFFHPANGAEDQITPNVSLTRAATGGLYNSVTESGATVGYSPAGTEWAIGDLSDYASLTYGPCLLEQGNHPPGFVGTNFVVHLIAEDIYLGLTLTSWGGQGESGDTSFSYNRTTASVAPPTPTVTLTNPLGGAVFAAPASLKLGASATVSSGSVTNVAYFAGGTLLGSSTAAPYLMTSPPLAAGTYSLSAVATAAGISATSTVVNVAVVSPVAVRLAAAKLAGGNFSFNYTANPGLSYVVQRSTNLIIWQSLSTNMAVGSPVAVTNTVSGGPRAFYRVGRLPNP